MKTQAIFIDSRQSEVQVQAQSEAVKEVPVSNAGATVESMRKDSMPLTNEGGAIVNSLVGGGASSAAFEPSAGAWSLQKVSASATPEQLPNVIGDSRSSVHEIVKSLNYSDGSWDNQKFDYGKGWAGLGFGLSGTQRGAPESMHIGSIQGQKGLIIKSADRDAKWYADNPSAIKSKIYATSDPEAQDDLFMYSLPWISEDAPRITMQVYKAAGASTSLRMPVVYTSSDGKEVNAWPGTWVYDDYVKIRTVQYGDFSIPMKTNVNGWLTLGLRVTKDGDMLHYLSPGLTNDVFAKSNYIASAKALAGNKPSASIVRQLDATVMISGTLVNSDSNTPVMIKNINYSKQVTDGEEQENDTSANTLIGGAGNDTYLVDNVGDVVLENANEGMDLVQSSVTYTLPANVENLTLTGTAAINGTGNAQHNVLTGNSASNVLDGAEGADTLNGGAGDDTYVVDNLGDTVKELANEGVDLVRSSVTYTLLANVENLTLTGTAAINGTGNAQHNVLTGNSASNVLDGAEGADTLAGGAGDDTYVVDNLGDTVTELVNEGVDLVRSSVTYTLSANVENLTLTGTARINGTGNHLDNVLVGNSGVNVLTGGAGNDMLDGGAGVDHMLGGTGNDIYVVDNQKDRITELVNEGVDMVRSSITFTLGANVENLTLTGTAAINGTGNALNNLLSGNSVNNALSGGAGNDVLDGGAGADRLTGGPGADYFVFSSPLGSTNRDKVTDFKFGEGDRILLAHNVFVQLVGKTSLDGSFRYLTQKADGNDFFVYDKASGMLYYDQSGEGIAMVEFVTLLNRPQDLTHTAFVIV